MTLIYHDRRGILAAPILALAFFLAAAPVRAATDVERVSLNWLHMIDAGQYDDSWAHSSSLLRQQKTPDQWQSRLQRLREAYGNFSMRGLAGISFSKSLTGFPDGRYATVRFQSSFFKQRDASETVSLRFEDGQWRPIAYSLR